MDVKPFPGQEPISTLDSTSREDRLREARERAKYGLTAWQENFDNAKADVRFLAGEQWPERVLRERQLEGRPALMLNKLPQYMDQVLGDQRQNRPAIRVHPVSANVGGKQAQQASNQAGTKRYTLAEVYEGLIRNVEYISNAEAHYDKAFQQALEGGFGWLRVLTKYATDDAFEQDVEIASIHNRFSVIMDPDCNEPDFSDANWCFVSENMPKKEFDKRYPNKRTGVLDGEEGSWWGDTEHVRVAEYFYREPVTRVLLLMSDGRTVWADEVREVLDEMAQQGITPKRAREVKTYKVMWMKITGRDVLEKPTQWPGNTIPIVPVLGKSIVIDDKTYYRGLIRYAKDAQRMHNYWLTAATERVALAPKSPFVGDAEAIEGYEAEWANANTSNASLLRYNSNGGTLPAPKREAPPSMPAAEMQLALAGTDEIKETIGIYDASLGQKSNETSGRAIEARQRQGDRGTFAYVDNLNQAIRRLGMILVDVIPKVYDSERVVRIRAEDESGDWVVLNQTIIDTQTGQQVTVNDLGVGKFDVVVKSGPSYATQRLQAADGLMTFVQAVPDSAQAVMDLIATNMDWPGSDQIAERLRKMLPPNLLSNEEKEELGMDPNTPDPQAAAAEQAAQVQAAQAQAEMAKAGAVQAKAEADIAIANARRAEAETRLAIEQVRLQTAQAGQIPAAAAPDMTQMQAMVRSMVADALAEFMSQQQPNVAATP